MNTASHIYEFLQTSTQRRAVNEHIARKGVIRERAFTYRVALKKVKSNPRITSYNVCYTKLLRFCFASGFTALTVLIGKTG